jgi:hypothetical protein
VPHLVAFQLLRQARLQPAFGLNFVQLALLFQ